MMGRWDGGKGNEGKTREPSKPRIKGVGGERCVVESFKEEHRGGGGITLCAAGGGVVEREGGEEGREEVS